MYRCIFLCGITFLVFGGSVIAEPVNCDFTPRYEELLGEENEQTLRAKQLEGKSIKKLRSACCEKRGPRGAIGPIGPKGDRGKMGRMGATGPTGNTGPTGATGPAGAVGVAGADGAAGATRSNRNNGSRGTEFRELCGWI